VTHAAFAILGLTVGLSLSRPTIWGWRIQPPIVAILGAAATVLVGLVPPMGVLDVAELLLAPVITIVSLMIITLVAEQAGLFEVVALQIARLAGGDGRRLFAGIFFAGLLTGAVFTNDAAVLIFTPLVMKLVDQIGGRSWESSEKVPYYFAVLYVANLVGGLVISNPINVILASLFGIGFLEYAGWMILPAVVSSLVTFLGIRFFFRKQIPLTYPRPDFVAPRYELRRMAPYVVVTAFTLAGFVFESVTHLPTWAVALAGAIALLVMRASINRSEVVAVLHGVGWDVIAFVFGIFVVAMGLRNVGLAEQIGTLIVGSAGGDLTRLSFTTGLVAAVCSAIMNNHPTTGVMAFVIQSMTLPPFEEKVLVYSALIGGDLGPKMLPVGSLAALMWFRILRNNGVQISYLLYVTIGVPVTLVALVSSILVLNLQVEWYRLSMP